MRIEVAAHLNGYGMKIETVLIVYGNAWLFQIETCKIKQYSFFNSKCFIGG